MPSLRLYQPRRPQASPLYRVLRDWAETFLTRSLDPSPGERLHPAPFAANSLRAFLECGIPRFGLVRFLCRSCGKDLFVPYSCKKRLACPSRDAKRSLLTTAHAIEGLLPLAAYRQWVPTLLPKRLRYFVHRDPRLVGRISMSLTAVLTSFYREQAGSSPDSAPALLAFVQRFGSS
ncbi:MAG: transposase zinc-binding domain-containing protein, partial [Elusimicrobia bacterium]|nr:transposase zinc-binding domain-containing protein [Elusimicrobiota bacterium]